MIYSVSMSSATAAELDVQLYDTLSRPAALVGKIRLRNTRKANRAGLRAAVLEAIASLEAVLAFPLPVLVIESTDEPEDPEAVNVLLEQVRTLRSGYDDDQHELLAAVRASGTSLSVQFDEARRAALKRLDDMESLLIVFGAGTDADAERGLAALPPMPDAPPGPSVELKH